MAHTKSGGSTKLGRDSAAQRLGVKINHGEHTRVGQIIIRQRGTHYVPGKYVAKAGDDSLYALKDGTVQFLSRSKIRFDGVKRKIKVITIEP